jgi:exodeoxyribonuclease VII large subunit
MIKLQASYDDRIKVKELGAHWNKNEKYWYIPDELDFHLFKEWIEPAEYERLNQVSTPLPLHDFFNVFAKGINLPNYCYTVEGDIIELHDFSDCNFSLLTLVDEHKYRQPLQIKIKDTLIADAAELLNKRVRITGTIHFYNKSGTIQLWAMTAPEIIGSCSRITEMQTLAQSLSKQLPNNQDKKKLLARMMDDQFSMIGIIAPPSSRGYHDFLNHLKPATKKRFDCLNVREAFSMEGSMDADFITEGILRWNEYECCLACICIVRGGGNPEELCAYNTAPLLTAIAETDIPIITGIGHDEDELLCDKMAALNAGTPTGVAEKLNEFANAKLKRDTDRKYKEEERQHPNTINWYDRCKLFEADNIKLRLENETLRAELEKAQKKGFFKRLFGF